VGPSDYDTLVVKYNLRGQLKWAETYDGGGADMDALYGIDLDSAGNVYATGYSRLASNYDYTTLKYDSRGNLLFVRNFDSGDYDSARDIAVDASGNINITGLYTTLQYDPDGTLQWVRDQSSTAIEVDGAGNIYLLGNTSVNGTPDIQTTVLDPNGSTIRTEIYDSGNNDYGNALAVDLSGTFFTVGTAHLEWGSDVVTIAYNTSSVNAPPLAAANGPYSGTTAIPLSFSSGGSYDPDGDAITFLWDLGDGTTSTEADPQHTYSSAGTYTVTLTVTDTLGAEGFDTATASITDGGTNEHPVASAGPDQTVMVRQDIVFDGSASYDLDGSITDYLWDFGNGKTGSGVSPSFSYKQTGTYTVTLTVTDDGGAQGTDTAVVTVVK
jgi:chitodextrinase